MKIAVYTTKWWAGKTPISINCVLDRKYALWTNEAHHVFDGFIPDKNLLVVGQNDVFPELPEDIDIVFDLSGSISETSQSIVSAVKQSDVVLIPIQNELKSIVAWISTIAEVQRFNRNIVVIATKLQRKKGDRLKKWDEVLDFTNIQKQVTQHYPNIPVLPLKLSTVFDTIFEQEKSINQLVKLSWLNKYHYRAVKQQFDAIYNLINQYDAK